MPRYSYWIGLWLTAASSGALAQPQPPGWEEPGGPRYSYAEPPGMRDPREGKVQVQTFVGNSPRIAELGHGPIVISAAGAPAGSARAVAVGADRSRRRSETEAALANLSRRRRVSEPGAAGPGQIVQYVPSRELIQPPRDSPHSPVEGGVSVGGGSRGSGMGLGIMVDLSKPGSARWSQRGSRPG